MKATSLNRLLSGQLHDRERRFAALARQLADDADAGKPYAHILHELILARHVELTARP